MDIVVCPHCQKHRIVTTQIPQDVVVVMPCPRCHELNVLFRNRILALSRRIIERGSFDERKDHIAQVIAQFLEAGLFPSFEGGEFDGEGSGGFMERVERALPETVRPKAPITQQELDKFVRVDLKCIDNAAYFRKHLG